MLERRIHVVSKFVDSDCLADFRAIGAVSVFAVPGDLLHQKLLADALGQILFSFTASASHSSAPLRISTRIATCQLLRPKVRNRGNEFSCQHIITIVKFSAGLSLTPKLVD